MHSRPETSAARLERDNGAETARRGSEPWAAHPCVDLGHRPSPVPRWARRAAWQPCRFQGGRGDRCRGWPGTQAAVSTAAAPREERPLRAPGARVRALAGHVGKRWRRGSPVLPEQVSESLLVPRSGHRGPGSRRPSQNNSAVRFKREIQLLTKTNEVRGPSQ